MAKQWFVVYDPQPYTDKDWAVVREDYSDASSRFHTQEEAWEEAKETAENQGTTPNPGVAYLRGRDGRIRDEATYPRDGDPEESKG